MTNIVNYIESEGGILSGRLAKYISETQNIEETAARKRVERLTSPIHKLKGFFSDNQSFVYHSNNFNNRIYFEKLEQSFESSAKRCFAVIVAINYHHGIIRKSDLPNFTFSPITKIKKHMSYSTLVEKLINVGVLIEYDTEHYCLNQYISTKSGPNFRHFKAIQFSKDFLINQFANWSKKIGLTSYNTGELNKEIGGFQFSFASPSYINGLVQYKENKPMPGFVVVDILIGNKTGQKEVNFFVQKVSAIRASNPKLKIFPVLILDGVEIKALNKLKEKGVLIATVKEIFGQNYQELLKNLINTITNAGAILKKDPESYIDLMNSLTKLIVGKTNNLRGDLFELAVGYYYGKFCQSLDIGKKIRIHSDPRTLEIDVLANYEGEVRAIECKGYNYPIDEEYVQKYLSDKIPFYKNWLEDKFPDKNKIFEIWSTGGFTAEATKLLEAAKKNTKRYSVDYLDKKDILERSKQLQTSKFSDILRDYYLKEIV